MEFVCRKILVVFLLQIIITFASTAKCPESELPVEDSFKLICAVAFWTKEGDGTETLDPFLCTHLTVIYAEINGDFTLNADKIIHSGVSDKIKRLKLINPNLRILITVGGYEDDSTPASHVDKYPNLMTNPDNTRKFVASVLQFLDNQVMYDGIEMQYVWPGRHTKKAVGGHDEAREYYANFTELFCSALKNQGYTCIISILKPFEKVDNFAMVSAAYKKIARYADYVVLFTADMPNWGLPEVAEWKDLYHTHSLYPPPDTEMSKPGYDFATTSSIANWTERFVNDVLQDSTGCIRKKIHLVTPMQANGYVLKNALRELPPFGTHVGRGFVDSVVQRYYSEICKTFESNESTEFRLESHYTYEDGSKSTPFAYNVHELFPMSDQSSVREQVKYVKRMGLGGTYVHHIDADDFNGWCFNMTFPLVHAIFDESYSDCKVASNFPAGCTVPNSNAQSHRPWSR